jgi:hypothetical protein
VPWPVEGLTVDCGRRETDNEYEGGCEKAQSWFLVKLGGMKKKGWHVGESGHKGCGKLTVYAQLVTAHVGDRGAVQSAIE